jgi:hypothetical protein
MAMLHKLMAWLSPIPDMPWWQFYLRCAWVVLRLLAAYCLAEQVSPFFYQRF